jgi:hypothetical protein
MAKSKSYGRQQRRIQAAKRLQHQIRKWQASPYSGYEITFDPEDKSQRARYYLIEDLRQQLATLNHRGCSVGMPSLRQWEAEWQHYLAASHQVDEQEILLESA